MAAEDMNRIDDLPPKAQKQLTKKRSAVQKAEKQLDESRIAYDRTSELKQQFNKGFSHDPKQNTLFGISCALFLLLDFFISQQTMDWLAVMFDLPITAIAFLFALIDSVVGISASGIFIKDAVLRTLHKDRWKWILRGLAVLKITLFLVFVHVVKSDGNEQSYFTSALMVVFISLIYFVLENAGEGLGFLFGHLLYFLRELWHGTPKVRMTTLKKREVAYFNLSKEFLIAQVEAEDFLRKN